MVTSPEAQKLIWQNWRNPATQNYRTLRGSQLRQINAAAFLLKGNDNMKKLIPALLMLILAAVMVGTSTFAWFSMNTQVVANGMQIKAVAEEGLVIKNELDADTAANWKISATASYNQVAAVNPTSTNDTASWYHNKSDDPQDAKASQATATYETVSTNAKWANEDGVYFIDTNEDTTISTGEKAYYLLNKFYIKSSGDEINPATFYINKVQATGANTSAELDKSLRVAIKIGSQVFIYAPVNGATLSYTVAGSAATTATSVPNTYIVNTLVSGTTVVPAITTAQANTIEADVFLYFEGEDANCKSENITATLDTLQVEITFGITTVA